MRERLPGGTPAHGERRLPKKVPAIAPSDFELVQAELRPHLKLWCAKIVEGVERGERTAMNQFGQAMRLTGAGVEINTLIVNAVGASVPRARQALEVYGAVEGIDEDQAYATALTFVREYCRARGREVQIVEAA